MIHIFIGTKAQLIKMAPIMVELEQNKVPYNFILSGQHKDTMADICANFHIKAPDVTLYHGPDITSVFKMLVWGIRITLKVLRNKKEVWNNDKSGIVLNHGDTFSTLLGTILARLSGLYSGHVESGLRSFNILHPFPEEITRLIVFKLSNVYFAPGNWALQHLEKYSGLKVNTEANTLLDSLNTINKLPTPEGLKIPEYDFGIVSIHRFENIYNKQQLQKIIDILQRASNSQRLVFILHKPTLKKLKSFKLLDQIVDNPNIETRPRYDYLRFIALVKHSKFVISDGGSNQEECYYLGKPCLLLREASEREEGIGENVVLSRFDETVIRAFVGHPERYKRERIQIEMSPAKLIVNSIMPYSRIDT
jgi:UDP-N-acetylglucosamine 2-epimerase (non-hydrolysing)